MNISYDTKTIKAWKANMPYVPMDFRPLPRRFYEFWRVLHVDGFGQRKIFFFLQTELES